MAGYERIVDEAQKVQNQTGIPASIIIGQAILESGADLDSGLASNGHNLFGIKGEGSAGSIYLPTTEYIDGEKRTVNAAFAKYDSYLDSIWDYAELISSPRYAKHLKNADSVEDYAKGIIAGGYATDPSYVDKLLGIISDLGLHQYDSGDFTFDPLAAGSHSGSGSGENEDAEGWAENIIYYVSRFAILGFLTVLAVIFFIKAFPAIKETAQGLTKKAVDAATTVMPAAKGVKKAVKAAKKTKKKVS